MPPKRSQHNTAQNREIVRLDTLVLKNDMQMRAQTSHTLVERYRRIFVDVGEEDCQCPPIVVYPEGEGDRTHYVVADGHHRVLAARRAGRTTLPAYVRDGTADEARAYAIDYNFQHGETYNREDTQKIIRWFLTHPRYSRLSDRLLSEMTHGHVSHGTFSNWRKRLKLAALEDVSNLDKPLKTEDLEPSFAVKVARLDRETSRLRDRVANVILATQDLPEARAELLPCVDALRAALARLEATVERLEGESDETDDA